MRRKYRLFLMTGLLFCVMVSPPSVAADWPQWRGEGRDARVARDILPVSWPEVLDRRWQVPVGQGHSGPLVVGDRIYVFSRDGEEESARALDLSDGRLLWRTAYGAPYELYPGAVEFGKGPRSTPVVVGGSLCTLGITGVLSCFDRDDGRLLWQKTFAGRFPSPTPPFGTAMSPLAVEGTLIAHVGGHDGGALIAFDPGTGEELWSYDGEGPGYASPILFRRSGQLQVVTQAHKHIIGVDARTGSLLWKLPFDTPCDQNIITPLVDGERIVFSSIGQGILAIEVEKGPQGWSPRIAWKNDAIALYMGSPVLAAGRIVGLSHRRHGQLFALDPATGEQVWSTGGRDGEYASFITSGEQVLMLTPEGEMSVFRAGPKELHAVTRFVVANSETWAHPVPTAQGILVKDNSTLSLLGWK